MATPTVDDELGCLVGAVARARGKTLEEFAVEALHLVICGNGGVRWIMRKDIPVMLVADEQVAINPDKVRRCLEEEGL